MSESNNANDEVVASNVQESHSPSPLSSLRSKFTSASTTSIDQAVDRQERFRNEENLRADLRRERRLRQQAISERVFALQEAMVSDLEQQHEMTLSSLETELRNQMEEEKVKMKNFNRVFTRKHNDLLHALEKHGKFAVTKSLVES